MVGETISHYRIDAELGQGGMGVVYRATDTRLNRTVALKMVRPELAGDPALRRRLAAEARAASTLSHPVIATVFDYDESGDSAFIVYEYVEGISLRELLRRRTLRHDEALSIAVRVADGLSAAHEAGIIHRDIKPDNIMVTPSGRAKILDFGLAKPTSAPGAGALSGTQTAATLTMPGTLVGTVNYMSPEQLESEPLDHRSDIFSFGVTLYEMVSRQHPFAGSTPLSTISSILRDEPPQLSGSTPDAAPELERIVRKCLRKRREERYQATRDLVIDLESLQRSASGAGEPATAQREFVLPRNVARILMVITQCGYLAMYGAALMFTGGIAAWGALVLTTVVVLALCGIPVRLYLLASLGFDHPQAGRNYARLFPAVLALDMFWAASPLLLVRVIPDGLALGAVAMLAYLPFSQRTLMRSAYR